MTECYLDKNCPCGIDHKGTYERMLTAERSMVAERNIIITDLTEKNKVLQEYVSRTNPMTALRDIES